MTVLKKGDSIGVEGINMGNIHTDNVPDSAIEWAKRAADQIRSKEKRKDLENERFVEEQQLRRHLAPRLWMRLRECLKERCNTLNLDLGKEIFVFKLEPTSQVVIRTKGGPRSLKVEYAEDGYRVYYECDGLSGEYLFGVKADTTVQLETSLGIPYTTEEVSEKLLGMLLQARASDL